MPFHRRMLFLVKITILPLLLHLAIARAASEASLALPGCQDKCGDVSIPYPFGIGKGCYLDDYFNVTCKGSIPSLSGPNSTLEILTVSLDDSYLHIRTNVATACYLQGNITTRNSTVLQSSKFPFSSSRNKFTAVGCDTAALMRSHQADKNSSRSSNSSIGGDTYTGCLSICMDETAVDEACTGVGCCQTSNFTRGLTNITIRISSFFDHFYVEDFNPCSYAFLVAEDSYQFRGIKDFQSLSNRITVPTALDWAVGFENCSQARMNSNSANFTCKKNSDCKDSVNGPGYICKCSPGFDGNPYIGCKDINECDYPESYKCKGKCMNTEGSWYCIDDKKLTLTISSICASIAVSVIVVVGFMLCSYARKRRIKERKEVYFRENGGLLLEDKMTQMGGSISAIKIFSAEELEEATDNFSGDRIVGRGGFGIVYKGCLSDGRMVAVKKSKMVDQNQIGQFINEVIVLSQINHRNVVRFLGCCLETPMPLLVYEFITNGTLSDHLHNDNHEAVMPWETRLKVATESAGVLAYLHSSHSIPIIHRDIKPTNILLDESYTAKVSDFGTSRLVPQNETHLSTVVQGTLGYLDPEYLHSSELTEKSDVYSFGVVLLELLTGRKAVSFEMAEEERSLVKYFGVMTKNGRILDIFDERITSEENLEQMLEVAKIVNSCLRVKGEERPTMKEVFMELEGLRITINHIGGGGNDDIGMEESKCLAGETSSPYDTNTMNTTSYSSTGDHIMLIPLGNGR